MNSNYNASMSFEFINSGNVYSYNGVKGEVTGNAIRDAIKYTPDRVNSNLASGEWRVIGELTEFPRPGVHAKYEKAKVFVVGKSGLNTDSWIIERTDGSIVRVRNSTLSEITSDDVKAFGIMKDLNVTYVTAMLMVNKGYGKL